MTEMNSLPSPQITIISITKNDCEGIRRTVASVQMQKFTLWQLVIVISNEQDCAFDYVKSLNERFENIHFLIPETLGIYHAMNHAIEVFGPKLTWFLNGGDVFKNESTLSNAYFLMKKHKPSILIGGYEVNTKDGTRQFVRSSRKIQARTFSLNVRSGNHQAMLFDFSEFEKIRFNTEFLLASDFLLILEILKVKSGFRTTEVFATVDPNGVSSLMVEEVWREKQNARRQVFGRYSVDWFLGHIWTLGVKTKRFLKVHEAQVSIIR